MPGSLCKQPEPCEYRFELTGWNAPESDASGGAPFDASPPAPSRVLPVRFASCVSPANFGLDRCAECGVMVEGTLCSGCHVFEASQVMATWPGKYRYTPPVQARTIPVCER